MKKEYIEPRLRITVLKSTGLLLTSGKGVYGSLPTGSGNVPEEILQYGGIDDTGNLDPE
jgi:hypothetical protein